MKSREQYLELRGRYQPDPISLIIVAESPPVSGLYFYDASGKTDQLTRWADCLRGFFMGCEQLELGRYLSRSGVRHQSLHASASKISEGDSAGRDPSTH